MAPSDKEGNDNSQGQEVVLVHGFPPLMIYPIAALTQRTDLPGNMEIFLLNNEYKEGSRVCQ
jgi:hypothetical protein